MSNGPLMVRSMDAAAKLLKTQTTPMTSALPNKMDVARFQRACVIACEKNPTLLECSASSFLSACLTSAQLGLDCSGTTGQAYLVPFNSQVVFITGYKGIMVLARRSGEILDIYAHVIREADEYHVELGSNPSVTHRPAMTGAPSPILGAYMVAHLKGGGKIVEWMTTDKIEAQHRDRSPSYLGAERKNTQSSPWHTDREAMFKKTAIRVGSKMLPMSVDLQKGLDHIDVPYEEPAPKKIKEADVVKPKPDSAVAALAATLTAEQQEAEDDIPYEGPKEGEK